MTTSSTATPLHAAVRRAAQPSADGTGPVRTQWQAPRPERQLQRDHSVLWVAVVVALALMSFYVHVLNEQVQRGEFLSPSERSDLKAPGTRRDVVSRAALGLARQQGQR